jgi:hypothetical protein
MQSVIEQRDEKGINPLCEGDGKRGWSHPFLSPCQYIGYNLMMNTNRMLGEKHRMIGFLHLKASKKIAT